MRTLLLALATSLTALSCAAAPEHDRVATNDHVASDVVLHSSPSTDENVKVSSTLTPPKEQPQPSAADKFAIEGAAALGGACEGKEDLKGGGPPKCGAKGRVAVEFDPYRPLWGLEGEHAPPCKLEAVGKPGSGEIQASQPSACVSGDHLIVSTVCMICRAPSGTALHARISEMTADQRAYAFTMMQLKGEPPKTAEGWAKAIAAK